mmetsp:Transcript_11678/g.21056  ORF Transcript_11678/g.21056 Transcript_11678/m.21056 type:complete len:108 (+) Transcript_11678:148-471(+)
MSLFEMEGDRERETIRRCYAIETGVRRVSAMRCDTERRECRQLSESMVGMRGGGSLLLRVCLTSFLSRTTMLFNVTYDLMVLVVVGVTCGANKSRETESCIASKEEI